MSDKALRIIELRSENVKRIKAVRVVPGGESGTVVITGPNGAGKTSVLDAIMFALAGQRAQKATPEPIRTGEDSAYVELDLGDFTVRRTWKGDKSEVAITAADGAAYGSPQSFLDKRLGGLTFDPLAFARADTKHQANLLAEVLHIDVEQYAQRRQGMYDARTEENRRAKDHDATARNLPVPNPELPELPEDVAELAAELTAAQDAVREYADAGQRVATLTARVEELRAELKEMEAGLLRAQEIFATQPPATPEDVDRIRERIAGAQATNEAVRQRDERESAIAKRVHHESKANVLSESISLLDGDFRAAVAEKAKRLLDGLGFDGPGGGVSYKGVPFSQCSAAEQLRVSVAMGMAEHPEIRVMRITDGSLLDSHSMAVIEELAHEHEYQVWIERVDETGAVGVVIEDGTDEATARGEQWPGPADTEPEASELCGARTNLGYCGRPIHRDEEPHGDWRSEPVPGTMTEGELAQAWSPQ